MAVNFFDQIDIQENGCWEWTYTKDNQGYGHYYILGKNHQAHRYSYEEYIGPIPEGLVIDHLCKNTSCVNPAHLEPVTQSENTLRGRTGWCKMGHEMTEENTRVRSYKGNTWRRCRICIKAESKNNNERRRALNGK